MLKLLISSIFLFLSVTNLNADGDDITINVEVDKDKIKLGEILKYTIEIKGNFVNPKVKLPEFKDFEVISKNQNTTYQIKGKNIEVNLNYIFYLIPKKEGVLFIEEVILKDKKGEFKSKSINIKVEKEKEIENFNKDNLLLEDSILI